MDRVEEPTVSSPSDESKGRTPAYGSFDSSTDKVLHVFHFLLRGIQTLRDDLATKPAPEVMNIVTEIKQSLRGKEASNQEPRDLTEMINNRVRRLSDPLMKPIQLCIPMKSASIPKQSGTCSEQNGSPRSRSEATLGICS